MIRAISLLFICFTQCVVAEEYIEVYKQNVLHRFVSFDEPTDNFTRNIFKDWENDTFKTFENVKDSNGIAIDLGAWIGTTSIWLSKNFHHVIAVEADRKSLICLPLNLKASACPNVTICSQPIAHNTENKIFGPIGSELNQSISQIKKASNNSLDSFAKSITLKQLIHDFVYQNNELNSHKISFIKCDIEGGEENILEDLLYFAYHNDCKAFISFHLDWWNFKNIGDFEYLFKFFKTDCPEENICSYLRNNPFASLLFEPKAMQEVMIKPNIPVFIIGYNQYTYIKNMVDQLEKFTSDISIIDNNSTFSPLLDYYNNEFKYTLLRQKENIGYTVYRASYIQNLTGDLYVLTDPDLKFNPNLPSNFLNTLINISNQFSANRVGFALLIDADDLRTDIQYRNMPVRVWESQLWTKPVKYPENESIVMYEATIDTTFCLINRKNSGPHYRVAGDFTCRHIPWHTNFKEGFLEGEYESYLSKNNSSNWFKSNK